MKQEIFKSYPPKQAVKSVSIDINKADPITPLINPFTKPSRSLTVFFAKVTKSFILISSVLLFELSETGFFRSVLYLTSVL